MKIFLIVTALALLTTTAYAVDVTLQWDPHPDPDLHHHTLYQADRLKEGTGPWAKVADIDKPGTTITIIVENGKNFAWVVTATGVNKLESGPSNMVQLYEPERMEEPACLNLLSNILNP